MVNEIEQTEETKHPVVELRLIQETDIPEVASIYAKSFNSAGVEENWTREQAEEFMTYWYKRQPDLFFIAKQGGKIVGGVVAGVKPWCTGTKLVEGELFVDPDFQHQGVGRRLTAKIIEESISKYGVKEFEGTADTNEDFPQNWYDRIGFHKTRWAVFTGDAEEMLKNLNIDR